MRTAFDVLSDVSEHPADVIAYLKEHGYEIMPAAVVKPEAQFIDCNPGDPVSAMWPRGT
jgi:predicted CoA-binding protein